MGVITINQFGSTEPSVSARALPPSSGQVNENLLPTTMEFRPLEGDVSVATIAQANPATLYRFDRNADGTVNGSDNTGWIGAAALLNLARWQLNDDTTGRIYYTLADGSQPMRWHNAAGENRRVGVPAPTTAPTITGINDSYVFTPDQKQAESQAVLEEAVRAALGFVIPSWTGPDALPTGWVRRSDFASPSDTAYRGYQQEAVRVFAVNPATDALIATYSDIAVNEASWVFNPALGGFFASLPTGSPLIPAWAAGHTKWWCVPVKAYAEVFDINDVSLKAALLALKMPGTQGAEPLLTSLQADQLIARLVEHGDKDGLRVRTKIEALRAKLTDLTAKFTRGASTSLATQMAAFYATTAVANGIESAKANYAESIWREVEKLGTATATPWYKSEG